MQLHELQQQFAEQLLGIQNSHKLGIVGAQSLTSAKAISIYRNNFLSNLSNGLRISFPVVNAILGETCFTQVAQDFAQHIPSCSGDLNDYGADFSNYLRTGSTTQLLPYLADVATLEWAIDSSNRAMDAAYADLSLFANYAVDELMQLKLPIHPACSMLHFKWPAYSIWQAHQHEDWKEPLQITEGDFFACVARADDTVRTIPLEHAEYVFLNHLARADTLETALYAAQEIDANFVPAPLIERSIALGVFC